MNGFAKRDIAGVSPRKRLDILIMRRQTRFLPTMGLGA
jgi:hypothetical protein